MWLSYALLAALFFGLRAVLYQWVSQKNVNRSLMLCGVYSTGFIVAIIGMLVLGHRFHSWPASIAGLSMGLFSFAANAALYKGFAVGKASVVGVLSGLASPLVMLLAYLGWGETLSPVQLIGFVILFFGINLIRYSNELSFKNLKGAHWALLASLSFAMTDLSSKQSTLFGADIFASIVLMFGFASLLFFISWWRTKDSVNDTQELRWSIAKTYRVGMAVGLSNVVGMVLILLAFQHGPTGLVSAVAAMNVLVLLVYSRVVLKDEFRATEIAGVSAALLGIVVLKLLS
ncbi:DMT family transporter [Reinekea thalattae]|uniref:DMT family transporter n=1 Tax=Reinekea thalattae TaxID=2593301 RepID=A0A5C8Z939_9GAMM|nr:DMT family transporter [Reinekea thalattae]TXR54665.1 DMT family transporter [Reinekea thalattae]